VIIKFFGASKDVFGVRKDVFGVSKDAFGVQKLLGVKMLFGISEDASWWSLRCSLVVIKMLFGVS